MLSAALAIRSLKVQLLDKTWNTPAIRGRGLLVTVRLESLKALIR